MNIFVSYTTQNNEVTVDSLINFSNKINSFGKIFIDIINNDSIDKQGRIVEELESSNLLILIKSESTLNSEWVKFELENAKRKGIPVIEFHIDEIETLTTKDIENKITETQN